MALLAFASFNNLEVAMNSLSVINIIFKLQTKVFVLKITNNIKSATMG